MSCAKVPAKGLTFSGRQLIMTRHNILFVMPALRSTQYTKLAYDSFVANTDSRHKLVIGMDLDVPEDRAFYETNGIPYKIYEGWGHWCMADYEVLCSREANDGFDFLGLVHNDMVFGYKWLDAFDTYCDEVQTDYDKTIFSFRQLGAQTSQPPISFVEQFDYAEFLDKSRRLYHICDMAGQIFQEGLSFLPWLMSYEALDKTFRWMEWGDFGILDRASTRSAAFKCIQFMGGCIYHFSNIATTLYPRDYQRSQFTDDFVVSQAQDPRYMKLAKFWYDNVNQSNGHFNKVLKEGGILV